MTTTADDGDDPDADASGIPDAIRGVRTRKAPTAFRTISEVADELHIPQHVLRFWETRFPQVKPLKRGGGRRYYRPDDIALLRSISHLLYIQGYTIKGVQRLLRETGGALGDDIPPAGEAERRESSAERAVIVGLPLEGGGPAAPGVGLAAGTAARPGVAAAEDPLVAILRELEALRDLLG